MPTARHTRNAAWTTIASHAPAPCRTSSPFGNCCGNGSEHDRRDGTNATALLHKSLDGNSLPARRTDVGVNSREAGKRVERSAVRTARAAKRRRQQFHQHLRGIRNVHGANRNAAFVANEIGIDPPHFYNKTAAAIHCASEFVRDDGIALLIVRHNVNSLAMWRSTRFFRSPARQPYARSRSSSSSQELRARIILANVRYAQRDGRDPRA
jgi:hypothetical protein